MRKQVTFWLTLLCGLSLILAACSAEPQVTQPPTATASPATQPPAAATDTPPAGSPPAASPVPATQAPSSGQPPVDRPPRPTLPALTDEQLRAQLQATRWDLISYLDLSGNRLSLPPGAPVTLAFTPDQVNGSSFCNSYFASYSLQDQRLTISQVGSTLMACEPPRMDLEKMYFQRLSEVSGIELIDNQLFLQDQVGQVLLTYSAAAAGAPMPAAPGIGGGETGQLTPLEAAAVPPGLQAEGLRNALYRSGFTVPGSAQLKDGTYQEAGPAGSTAQTVVRLTDFSAYASLPDGKPAAAVILVTETGGSGGFYELHLLNLLDNGQPADLGSIFLGDRVKINSLAVKEGNFVIDMIGQGPQDPMCCPTQPQTVTVSYQDGQLAKQVQTEATTPVPGAAITATLPTTTTVIPTPVTSLNGAIWQWAEFEDGQGQRLLVNQPYQYVVEFTPNGELRIQADCNSGTGRYTQNGNQLSLEALTLTKMACPPASLSEAFAAHLRDVAVYTLNQNALYLTLKDGAGVMKLTPAP